jgi:hypothetical protein
MGAGGLVQGEGRRADRSLSRKLEFYQVFSLIIFFFQAGKHVVAEMGALARPTGPPTTRACSRLFLYGSSGPQRGGVKVNVATSIMHHIVASTGTGVHGHEPVGRPFFE